MVRTMGSVEVVKVFPGFELLPEIYITRIVQQLVKLLLI